MPESETRIIGNRSITRAPAVRMIGHKKHDAGYVGTWSQPLDESGRPFGASTPIGPTSTPGETWGRIARQQHFDVLASTGPRAVIRGEAGRLRAMDSGVHLAMAEALDTLASAYPDPVEAGVFSAGTIHATRASRSIVGGELDRYLGRHLAGDFGGNGAIGDAVETPESEWCPEAFDWATRNAAAIRTGSGMVVSTYAVPKDQSYQSRTPGVLGPSGGSLHVVTWLLPGDPAKTAVFSSHDGILAPS